MNRAPIRDMPMSGRPRELAMSEPLTQEERWSIRRTAEQDIAWMDEDCGWENKRGKATLRLLADLERVERERDEWRDVAKCEGENEAHERALVERAQLAEARLARIVEKVARTVVYDVSGWDVISKEILAIAKGER